MDSDAESAARQGQRRSSGKSKETAEWLAGMYQVLPAVVAVLPFGLLMGTLAAQKGLTPSEVAVMGATVFAGGAQFVAIELWREPVPVMALAATVAMVNLRHILMGAALARYIDPWPVGLRRLGLFFMADENWALSLRRGIQMPLSARFYFAMALPLYLAWVASSTFGALFGAAFRDPARYGFDFAFSAIFLVLLAGLWQGRRSALPWSAAALAAVLGHEFLPGAWYVLLGGVTGTLVGWLQGEAR